MTRFEHDSSTLRGSRLTVRFAVACQALVCLASTLVPLASAQEQAAAPTPVIFSKEIAPILIKNCQGCHGQSEPKGDYQLYTYTLLMKPGASTSPSVTASKLEE